MNKLFRFIVFITLIGMLAAGDALARGGRGGGGGGGRGGGGYGGGGGRGGYGGGGGGYRGGGASYARPSAGRTPSVSRPATRPASRPSSGVAARPGSRPGGVPPRVSQPIAGARPGGARPGGARPGTGRPGAGGGVAQRPTTGQINDFLDVRPGGGGAGRPSTLPAGRPGGNLGAVAGGIAGGVAGGAAAEFLRDRPSQLPAGGARPGIGERPGTGERPGVGERPGLAERPGIGERPISDRPGLADRPMAENRPDRIENRQEYRDNRVERRDEVRNQVQENHPRLDFWSDHPNWAAWRINHPYRWAAWGALAGWVPYGWSEPAYYSYGENVYYEGDSVYYGDQPVCSAEEYTQQAEAIVASAPEVAPEEAEWMPLGVFALTPDGQASGPDPTLYLQLAISKEGVISGTLHNTATNATQTIEGMADKATQRVAWTVAGKSRPIMETGIANLTQDSSPALVHFADGTSQQWLMVRLDEPPAQPQ